jgi:hypothetical protein
MPMKNITSPSYTRSVLYFVNIKHGNAKHFNSLTVLLIVKQILLKNFLISFCLEGNLLAVEMKDLFARYSNDVIATSAFGIECDSLKNPKNEFYEMGRNVTNNTGVRALIIFGYMMSPKLMKVRMSVLHPQHNMMTVK